jgi:hypothetical protein
MMKSHEVQVGSEALKMRGIEVTEIEDAVKDY